MKFSTYQTKARATAVFPRVESQPMIGVMYAALGCAGEAGEIAEEVKKAWRNDEGVTPERVGKIAKEVGDELWYLAAICDELGLDLETIAADNLEKLAERQRRNELKERA